MTLQIKEVVPSRTFTSGSGFGASRSFLGYDDDIDINADPVDIMEAPSMPSYGQAHPDAPSLLAKEFTMTPSAEGNGIWDVVWTYTVFEPGEEGSNPLEPPDAPAALFTRLDVNATVPLVDFWRDVSAIKFPGGIVGGVNSPTQFSDGGSTAGYIAATNKVVAWGGQAITYALPTSDITISHDVDAVTMDIKPALDKVAKRNLGAWEGFDAGSVLFAGVSVSRTAPLKYKITYNLSFDSWFHLRQIPERHPDGELVINKSDPADVIINVEWRQPFPETVDFGFIPEL